MLYLNKIVDLSRFECSFSPLLVACEAYKNLSMTQLMAFGLVTTVVVVVELNVIAVGFEFVVEDVSLSLNPANKSLKYAYLINALYNVFTLVALMCTTYITPYLIYVVFVGLIT